MEPSPKVRKRVREACENCRRKKGRCPGEKPVCSLCARLHQTCVYAGETHDSSFIDGIQQRLRSESEQDNAIRDDEEAALLKNKVESLDDKLTEVLEQVRLLAHPRRPPVSFSPVVDPLNTVSAIHSNSDLRKAARLYLKYCHCQPLPLLVPDDFENHIASKDAELRLAVVVAAHRFANENIQSSVTRTTHEQYHQQAASIIMSRIDNSNVELATLQALCLLTYVANNEGYTQKAGIYLAILLDLAQSSRLDIYAHQSSKNSNFEEYTRCLWTIIMLQYLCGGVGLMSLEIDTKYLNYPAKESSNELATINKQNSSTALESDKDLGIVAYALQMTEAWYRVRHYVHHRGRLDKHPPWSGQSIYSEIMSRQMELESHMPHKHRFNPSGFADHTITVLSTNRPYWAPWLYLQLIYHSIVCTLNHPLLLSNHLRRFRVNQIPELFLQHIGDMLTSHTDWFIHLLDIAAMKQFELSDPFLGRCIAIVATIFLQQSYTEDEGIREDKRRKYQICLDQVLNLGKFWPHVQEIANDLQHFEATITKAFETSSDTSPHLSSYVDMAAFWRIMDSHSASSTPTGSRSIFGSSLRLRTKSRGESELLSTRLIPEPTRVHSLYPTASTASTPLNRGDAITSIATKNGGIDDIGLLGPDLLADSPFLAENFFTLGQDFVGNADEWFNWTELVE